MKVGYLIPGSLLTTRATVVKERKTNYTIRFEKSGPNWEKGSLWKIPKEQFMFVDLSQQIRNVFYQVSHWSFFQYGRLGRNIYGDEHCILGIIKNLFHDEEEIISNLEKIPEFLLDEEKEKLFIHSDRLMEIGDERGWLLSSFLNNEEKIHWIPELLEKVKEKNRSSFTSEITAKEIVNKMNRLYDNLIFDLESNPGVITVTFDSIGTETIPPPPRQPSRQKERNVPKHVPKRARRKGKEYY